MKLHTREWGSGDRIALLVHGIMSDSRTWYRVAPVLAERGYRVVAVDLRGHGASGRADEYPTEAYGTDVIETIEALGGVDLAIGHSLGGLAVLLAVEAGLRPSRAVYVDPAWRISRPEDGFDPARFVEFADHATREAIATMAPRWEPEQIEIELATLAVWDRRTALELSKHAVIALDARTAGDGTGLPLRADVPSLIMLAEQSQMVDAQDAETLRQRGFALRTVPEAGHSIHRDDLEGFMTALEGWL
jgi:pimeloyl-ACP methyl ester carboxylesterase